MAGGGWARDREFTRTGAGWSETSAEQQRETRKSEGEIGEGGGEGEGASGRLTDRQVVMGSGMGAREGDARVDSAVEGGE
jgi:hypothetical protein